MFELITSVRMPPRIPRPVSSRLITGTNRTRTHNPSSTLSPSWLPTSTTISARRHYAAPASIAATFKLPDDYVPPTKPPSARPVETRKSQLLRSYTSLLRSTPLMLIFQQNNLSAIEWAALRRELKFALAAVPPPSSSSASASPDAPAPAPVDIAPFIQLQVVRTSMFRQALKVLEFWDPTGAKEAAYTHDLSMAAYEAVKAAEAKTIPADSMYAQLQPLLVGPLCLLTFPAVSPQHLAAALSILAPSSPAFPAPTRKKNPGYHDQVTQSGLQKLLLIGGRIEGKAFDMDGVRWVGGIEGGLDGLRAQLVGLLQNAGLGLTSTLEGASKSLWVTMESRRTMLEEGGKEGEKKE
ncbi:hypothetical protein N0V82_009191 [Gnomoniopsis sp. IMI 355080]|nr:hypothetical protein N0V82_009191 [Gnomoniopsis sp. IMI 355080]